MKVTASASQKGSKIDIKAEVTTDAKPGDKVRLRLVLVEEKVEYTGSNKVAEHHHVVRHFPGGTDGVVVRETTAKAAATVDLDELRKSLKEAWQKTADMEKIEKKDQPLELKKLKVVAFVQNDTTKEILQAVQVDVKAAEGKRLTNPERERRDPQQARSASDGTSHKGCPVARAPGLLGISAPPPEPPARREAISSPHFSRTPPSTPPPLRR